MKEIDVQKAIEMKYAMIDLDIPEKGYEKYDFHTGTKCKIDGYPFQLVYENGKYFFAAGAIYLTKHYRKPENVTKFFANETIAILSIKNEKMTAYEFTIPGKIRQQDFVVS